MRADNDDGHKIFNQALSSSFQLKLDTIQRGFSYHCNQCNLIKYICHHAKKLNKVTNKNIQMTIN